MLRTHATALIAIIQPVISDETYTYSYTAYYIAEGFAWQVCAMVYLQ